MPGGRLEDVECDLQQRAAFDPVLHAPGLADDGRVMGLVEVVDDVLEDAPPLGRAGDGQGGRREIGFDAVLEVEGEAGVGEQVVVVDPGQERQAGVQGTVAEDLLQIQGPEENIPSTPVTIRPRITLERIRPCSLRMRSGKIGLGWRFSTPTKVVSSTSARARGARVWSEPQP